MRATLAVTGDVLVIVTILLAIGVYTRPKVAAMRIRPMTPPPVKTTVTRIQELTAKQIDQAIAIGSTKKQIVVAGCVASPPFMDWGQWNGSFQIMMLGPLNRVTLAAFEAKKKYLSFGPDQVTPQMLSPTVTVTAEPDSPKLITNAWHQSTPETHVIVRSKPPKGTDSMIAQPAKVETFSRSWSNPLGAQWTSQGVTGYFDLGLLRDLAAGDLEVVVITDAGERKCRIKASSRPVIQ